MNPTFANASVSAYQDKQDHYFFLLDASSSLLNWDGRKETLEGSNAEKLIHVVDAEIRRLAAKADKRELDPQTGRTVGIRVSIAQFASRGQYRMLIWDMDPRDLPSIAELYKAHGNTAMCEAVVEMLQDIKLIPQKYGDHGVLMYVFTDGEENDSKQPSFTGYGTYRNRYQTTSSPVTESDQVIMQRMLAELPENVTVAAFVPEARDHRFKRQAIAFGLPADNVSEWDVSSKDGVFEVGRRVEQASEAWSEARGKGIKSTRTLFSTGVDAVNDQTVADTLEALSKSAYKIFTVTKGAVGATGSITLKEFMVRQKDHKGTPIAFKTRHAHYRLRKSETIQVSKAVLVRRKADDAVFGGDGAREMIGLHDSPIKRGPDFNPAYDTFVMSGSATRKLEPGDEIVWVF